MAASSSGPQVVAGGQHFGDVSMEVLGPGPSGDAVRSVLESMGPSSSTNSVMSTDSSFICSGMLPAETELRLRKIFKQCDLSGCGGFNECELIMSCQRSKDIANFFGLPQRVYKEDGSLEMLAKIFKAIDANEDHEINWEEFCDFFSKRILAVMAMGQARGSSCGSSIGTSRGNSGATMSSRPYDNPYAEEGRNEELLVGSARDYDQEHEPVVESRGHSLATHAGGGHNGRDFSGTCLGSNKCLDCGAKLGLVFGMHGFGKIRRRHAAVCTARRSYASRHTSVGSRASRMANAGMRSASLPSVGRNTSASSVPSSGSRKGTPAQPEVGTMHSLEGPRSPRKGQDTDYPDESKSSLRLSQLFMDGNRSVPGQAEPIGADASPERSYEVRPEVDRESPEETPEPSRPVSVNTKPESYYAGEQEEEQPEGRAAGVLFHN